MAVMMLITNGIPAKEIKELSFNKKQRLLFFSYKNRKYSIEVLPSVGTYIKLYKNGSISLIKWMGRCNNSV